MNKYGLQVNNDTKKLEKNFNATNMTQEKIDDFETKALKLNRSQIIITDTDLYNEIANVYSKNTTKVKFTIDKTATEDVDKITWEIV